MGQKNKKGPKCDQVRPRPYLKALVLHVYHPWDEGNFRDFKRFKVIPRSEISLFTEIQNLFGITRICLKSLSSDVNHFQDEGDLRDFEWPQLTANFSE